MCLQIKRWKITCGLQYDLLMEGAKNKSPDPRSLSSMHVLGCLTASKDLEGVSEVLPQSRLHVCLDTVSLVD